MKTPKIIHIFGASGAGTTTLGRAIAERIGYFHMDTDDYFWLPTDPKFTRKRDAKERIALMKRDIEAHKKVVISGSLCGWGDELTSYFDLAVRVVTATDVRIQRIRKREYERFGERILEGGDMHGTHLDFLAWASKYDYGTPDMRSKARHDLWQSELTCEVRTVNGERNVEEMMEELGL